MSPASVQHKKSDEMCKGKGIPLQAWTGPEVSRRMGLMKAHEGGKLVSPTPRKYSTPGRIMSTKNFCDTIGNRTRDLPNCSAVL